MRRYICIVFTDFHHTKLYPFQNLSLEFILKVFLRFCKFQPRYSYKIYSYRKKKSVLNYCLLLSNTTCKTFERRFKQWYPYFSTRKKDRVISAMSRFSVGVNSRGKNLAFYEYVKTWQFVYHKYQQKKREEQTYGIATGYLLYLLYM